MEDNQFGEQKDFQEHLDELKSSLKYAVLVFLLSFIGIFLISDLILVYMQKDLAVNLHGLSPFEVLNVRLAISFILGLITTAPVIVYILMGFVKPGLTKKEIKLIKNFLPITYVLFIVGALFAYQFVFKNAVNFFIEYTKSAGVTVVWGLKNTLILGFRLSILTGLLFQLPLVITVLNKAGIINVRQLREYRPYVIVAVLLIASVATPPDIITQILITVPILILYQLSIEINTRI